MVGNVQAELASFLADVELVDAGRWHHVEAAHELADDEREDGQREDDPGAAASAHAEGQEAEVHLPGDGGVDALLLTQEPLRSELLGFLPQLRVVGQPPGVHHHLGALGYGVPAELGLLEVHVRHEERDGGVEAQRLLDHGLQVGEPVDVGLRDGLFVSEGGPDLVADLALHRRVVNDLGERPLDGPERGLDGGDVDVLNDVDDVLRGDLAVLLGLEDVVDGAPELVLVPRRVHDLPPLLYVPASVEVPSQEGAQDGDEVAVVVVETLRKAAALGVEPGGLHEHGVVNGVEAGVEHHPMSETTASISASHMALYCCTTRAVKKGSVMTRRMRRQWSPYSVKTMSAPLAVKMSKTRLRGREPNSTPCVCSTSVASRGSDTTTRLRTPRRRRNTGPYRADRRARKRWLRSLPTRSQLPKTGTAAGPGGALSEEAVPVAAKPRKTAAGRSRPSAGWRCAWRKVLRNQCRAKEAAVAMATLGADTAMLRGVL
ncbi:hypothetical protein U9M48_023875, partial [Paspalum notatum var. saurae]